MATHIQAFASAVGGYPDVNNEGNQGAVTDDANEFYIDIGKFTNYETIIFSDPTATNNLLSYGTVSQISVMIKNAQSTPSDATVDIALWHTTDNAYTDYVRFNPPDSATDVHIEGNYLGSSMSLTWDKVWNADDINGIGVKIFNPIEPTSGIALRATYVYVVVTYDIAYEKVSIGKLKLTTGKIQLTTGKLVI